MKWLAVAAGAAALACWIWIVDTLPPQRSTPGNRAVDNSGDPPDGVSEDPLRAVRALGIRAQDDDRALETLAGPLRSHRSKAGERVRDVYR